MLDSAGSLTPRFESKDWRIDMLTGGSGFPNRIGPDDFGLGYNGPGLNGKSVSIRSVGANSIVMRVPALVASEMRKDAEVGAPFTVDAGGAMDSSVLIRTIALESGPAGWNLRTAAGGGIVADSDPREERIETETKLSLIQTVLEGGT